MAAVWRLVHVLIPSSVILWNIFSLWYAPPRRKNTPEVSFSEGVSIFPNKLCSRKISQGFFGLSSGVLKACRHALTLFATHFQPPWLTSGGHMVLVFLWRLAFADEFGLEIRTIKEESKTGDNVSTWVRARQTKHKLKWFVKVTKFFYSCSMDVCGLAFGV